VSPATLFGWTGNTNPPGAFTNGQPVISAGSFIGNGSGLTNLTIPPSSSYVSSVNGTATNLNVFGNFSFLYNSNTNSHFAYSSVTNCLVAWWPFNGNMYDVWGGNDCLATIATYTANGESMQALVATDPATPPPNPAFNLTIITNWTFSCWVCLTNSSTSVSFVADNNFTSWNFYYYPGVGFTLRGRSSGCWTCGADNLSFPAALPLNQWVHVAVVCNLYNATVYTNGVAFSPQLTGTPWTENSQNQLTINGAAYGVGPGNYLDECAWFTNCLSAAEVASIYYAGANSLNMGAPLVYTNNGFVIGLTGVSLPTGQTYYGDGSGLTNLNAGGGTNGGAPLAAGPGITITPTGGSNTLSVTPGTYDPFGAAAAAQSASDPAGTATAAVRAATNTLAAAALAGNVPAASLGNIAAGANVTITTNGGQVVIGATGGGSGGVALWTSAGGFIFPNGNTGTNNGWISTGPTLYPQ
jgi:hypothetical protein